MHYHRVQRTWRVIDPLQRYYVNRCLHNQVGYTVNSTLMYNTIGLVVVDHRLPAVYSQLSKRH